MKKFIHLILTMLMIEMMTISSFASEMYVYDEAGILSAEELVGLDAKAAEVSETYGYGVYVIAVKDYQAYSTSDVYTTATEMYHGLQLGEGADREGILLMLSMEDRDYATFFYGEHVEYAFNEYGQIQLEEQFLDDFSEDRWYDGFYDYVTTCEEYLSLADAGNPVRKSAMPMILVAVAVSLLIAFIVSNTLKNKMKSVSKRSVAHEYITKGGLNLTTRSDLFLYQTENRRKIEKSSDSESHSGGGGSGRSGKF